MATWSNVTVTNKGYALQAKLLSTDKLVITRVVSGSDRVVAGQLVNQTEISNIKQNLVVESLHYDDKGNAIIKVSTTNDGLSSTYDCNQVGIYAADPDEGEILYMIAQEAVNGERIPSIAEQPYGFYTAWLFALTYSNAQNVSVTIDPSYALTQESADSRYLQLTKIGDGLEYDENGNLKAKAQALTVDDTVNKDSSNPVQNKAVYVAIENSKYTHPTHEAKATGFYKREVDSKGHVVSVTEVKKSDITALGIPAQDTKNTTGTELSENITLGLVGTEQFNENGAVTKASLKCYIGPDNCLYSNSKKVSVEGHSHDLPIASSSQLGGVMVGEGLSIDGGVLSNALGKLGRDVSAVVLNGNNVADNSYAVAMGSDTSATGFASTAMGSGTSATNGYATAMGYMTTADGGAALATGWYNTANGNYSFVAGTYNTAVNLQMVIGRYADTSSAAKKGPSNDTSTVGSLFVIGNGTAEDKVGNAFRVSTSGTAYSTSGSVTTGADGAEFYPWADGNPNAEDRIGRFVTLDGEKIRFATSDDEDIEGVISDMDIASFIGDCYADHWHGKFLKDVFGRRITENVEIEAYTDENGVEHPAETVTQFKLNPEFDPKQVYISREDRAEYGLVALWGKVVVIDDGTCKVNGYCKPGKEGGIATASDTMTPYRVMERIDENHVRIRIKNCR